MSERCVERRVEVNRGTSFFMLQTGTIPRMLLEIIRTGQLLSSNGIRSIRRTARVMRVDEDSFCGCGSSVFPCRRGTGKGAIGVIVRLSSRPKLLSVMLGAVTRFRTGVLAVRRDIPIGKVTSLSLDVSIFPTANGIRSVEGDVRSIRKVRCTGVLTERWRG